MEKKIENIIFDVGDVLISFCWKKACRELGFHETIIECFEKYMVLSDVWDMLDEGTIEHEQAIQIFIQRMPQLEKEIRTFWQHADKIVEEFDYSAKVIQAFKNQGKKVYLLSNYPLEMYQLHWPAFSFFDMVDGYVVSAVEKMKKPDVRIYQLLCERYHLKPETCMFFDDRQSNVDAAIQSGMQATLFKGYETIKPYL